jgi:hypothetical protein
MVKFMQGACVPPVGPVEWLVAGRTVQEHKQRLSFIGLDVLVSTEEQTDLFSYISFIMWSGINAVMAILS